MTAVACDCTAVRALSKRLPRSDPPPCGGDSALRAIPTPGPKAPTDTGGAQGAALGMGAETLLSVADALGIACTLAWLAWGALLVVACGTGLVLVACGTGLAVVACGTGLVVVEACGAV